MSVFHVFDVRQVQRPARQLPKDVKFAPALENGVPQDHLTGPPPPCQLGNAPDTRAAAAPPASCFAAEPTAAAPPPRRHRPRRNRASAAAGTSAQTSDASRSVPATRPRAVRRSPRAPAAAAAACVSARPVAPAPLQRQAPSGAPASACNSTCNSTGLCEGWSFANNAAVDLLRRSAHPTAPAGAAAPPRRLGPARGLTLSAHRGSCVASSRLLGPQHGSSLLTSNFAWPRPLWPLPLPTRPFVRVRRGSAWVNGSGTFSAGFASSSR